MLNYSNYWGKPAEEITDANNLWMNNFDTTMIGLYRSSSDSSSYSGDCSSCSSCSSCSGCGGGGAD